MYKKNIYVFIYMANLQNFRNKRSPSMLESIGQKVKNGIEFAGAVKGIYDVGKVVYSGFVAAAPYLEAAMLAGL
jgi:hypothetical protein